MLKIKLYKPMDIQSVALYAKILVIKKNMNILKTEVTTL